MTKRKANKSIVIGTIGADAHMIGSWVLAKAFEDAGFKVAFLGAVVPQKDFINAAIEVDADAILVSSMYGMGLLDCEGFREKCIEAGLKDIILYVGGTVAAISNNGRLVAGARNGVVQGAEEVSQVRPWIGNGDGS